MTKDIVAYQEEIKQLHEAVNEYPDSESLQSKLKYRLGKWADLLEITVFAASNEQQGYSSVELGLPVKPMYTKDITGKQQVADYQAFIGGAVDQWCGLLVERKGGKAGVDDFYGTLMNRDSRERFNREILRYERDERFNQMLILVEGSFQDFLTYSPKFNGKTYNKNHIGASVESKRGTVAALYAKGVPVLWCGSRSEAVRLYPQLIRHWCIKNYMELLYL